MQKVFRTRRRKVIAVLVVLALVVASAALAAWLVSSTGKARGKASSLAPVTFVPASSAEIGTAGDLLPGGTGSVWIKATNPSSVPMVVQSAARPGGGTQAGLIVSSDPTGCPASNVTDTLAGGPKVYTAADSLPPIPANASGVLVRLPGVLAMSSTAPNACQGVDFLLDDIGGVAGNPPLAVTFATGY